MTYIDNNEGFAYFEITGDVEPGTYLLFVTYDGVTVDHFIEVLQDPDSEAPVITDCPDAISDVAADDVCELEISLAAPSFDDNCPNSDVVVTYQVSNPDNSVSGTFDVSTDPEYTFDVGTSQVTWFVTDTTGNESTCVQEVEIVDDQEPTVECPAGLQASYTADAGACSFTMPGTGFDATADDNCEVASLTHDYGGFGNPNTLMGASFPVGTTTVTWTAEDVNGNTATCSFDVVVTDDENPSFVNCPVDTITVGNDFSNCDGGVNWSVPIAEDNCGVDTVVRYTGPAPGQILAVGVYEIGYEATDVNGNVDTCTFFVEVIDSQEPIIGCPQDITISTDADVCEWASQAGSLTPSIAIENCEPNLQWSVENPDGTTEADSGDVSGYVFDLR